MFTILQFSGTNQIDHHNAKYQFNNNKFTKPHGGHAPYKPMSHKQTIRLKPTTQPNEFTILIWFIR